MLSTCLPAMEKHPNNLDDSDQAEAQEEGKAEHVQLQVRPIDLHGGRLPDHLGGDEGDVVEHPVLSSKVRTKVGHPGPLQEDAGL